MGTMLSLAHGVLCLRYTEKSLRAKVATCSGNCNYNAPPGTLLRADQLSATLSRRHGAPRIAINGSVCSGTVRDVSVWRFHQNVGGGIFAVPREDSPAHRPKTIPANPSMPIAPHCPAKVPPSRHMAKRRARSSQRQSSQSPHSPPTVGAGSSRSLAKIPPPTAQNASRFKIAALPSCRGAYHLRNAKIPPPTTPKTIPANR